MNISVCFLFFLAVFESAKAAASDSRGEKFFIIGYYAGRAAGHAVAAETTVSGESLEIDFQTHNFIVCPPPGTHCQVRIRFNETSAVESKFFAVDRELFEDFKILNWSDFHDVGLNPVLLDDWEVWLRFNDSLDYFQVDFSTSGEKIQVDSLILYRFINRIPATLTGSHSIFFQITRHEKRKTIEELRLYIGNPDSDENNLFISADKFYSSELQVVRHGNNLVTRIENPAQFFDESALAGRPFSRGCILDFAEFEAFEGLESENPESPGEQKMRRKKSSTKHKTSRFFHLSLRFGDGEILHAAGALENVKRMDPFDIAQAKDKIYGTLIQTPQGYSQFFGIQTGKTLDFFVAGIRIDGVEQPKVRVLAPYNLLPNGKIEFQFHQTNVVRPSSTNAIANGIRRVEIVAYYIPEIKCILIRPKLVTRRGFLDHSPVYMAKLLADAVENGEAEDLLDRLTVSKWEISLG